VRTLGSVFKRGAVYYIVFTHRGRRYKESSGSTQRKVAIALLRRRISEVVEGRLLPRAERTTFENLVKLIEDDYRSGGRKSGTTMRYCLAHLRAGLGKILPADLTYQDLTRYVSARANAEAAPATIRREVATLGRMFKLAVRAGLLKIVPPLPTVHVQNARQGFFEDDELARLLAALPEDLRPLVEFIAITGWRSGEARGLKWANVDFAAGTVTLAAGTTKSGAARVFPFSAHPRLAALLHEQRKQARMPWVFQRDGQKIGEFKRAWKTACREAGCPGRVVHDLRRTACRRLVRNGVPEGTIMALCGWKTRAIFDRYNIVSLSDLQEGVRRDSRA